jgi:bifunctional enzyme CysN/CysC
LGEGARTGTRFRANIFWMGRAPMLPGKRYKLKLGAARVPVELAEVRNVVDASELASIQGKRQVDRHDVGECVFETARPVAFDLATENEKTARFVIVDDYEIAGCGMVLEQVTAAESLLASQVHRREITWQKGYVTAGERGARYRHQGKFVVFAGAPEEGLPELAKRLEQELFREDIRTYYLSLSNVFDSLDNSADADATLVREEQLRRLGELARIFTDAGLIFITALENVDQHDLEKLKLLNEPHELFVVCGSRETPGDLPLNVRLSPGQDVNQAVRMVRQALTAEGVTSEYFI